MRSNSALIRPNGTEQATLPMVAPLAVIKIYTGKPHTPSPPVLETLFTNVCGKWHTVGQSHLINIGSQCQHLEQQINLKHPLIVAVQAAHAISTNFSDCNMMATIL